MVFKKSDSEVWMSASFSFSEGAAEDAARRADSADSTAQKRYCSSQRSVYFFVDEPHLKKDLELSPSTLPQMALSHNVIDRCVIARMASLLGYSCLQGVY